MDGESSRRPELGSRDALLRRIAIGSCANHLILTEDAWSTIENESLEALEFLSVVAFAKADGLHLHLLSRAWFESQALRRFGLAHWGVSSN